jgi:hypothetical protein
LEQVTYTEIVNTEMCRRAPGLAPILRLLWAHVLDTRTTDLGRCCTDGNA